MCVCACGGGGGTRSAEQCLEPQFHSPKSPYFALPTGPRRRRGKIQEMTRVA